MRALTVAPAALSPTTRSAGAVAARWATRWPAARVEPDRTEGLADARSIEGPGAVPGGGAVGRRAADGPMGAPPRSGTTTAGTSPDDPLECSTTGERSAGSAPATTRASTSPPGMVGASASRAALPDDAGATVAVNAPTRGASGPLGSSAV